MMPTATLEYFNAALLSCGIQGEHTPHDCRHTFNMLLDNAGVDRVTRYKLMGHTLFSISDFISDTVLQKCRIFRHLHNIPFKGYLKNLSR